MFWRGSDVTELLDNKYDNYVLDHTLVVSYHITDTLTLSHATVWAGRGDSTVILLFKYLINKNILVNIMNMI